MRAFITILFFLSVQLLSNAQLKWPAINQQTKPWTRWWWQGSAVDKENIARLMREYKKAGLGGLEITPIYGVKGTEAQFRNFLSPEWMDVFLFTLQEAKKMNMGIDMATGTGWPFGGPWIKTKDASKYFVVRDFDLRGGRQLEVPIVYRQEGFVRTANGKPLSLSQLAFPVESNKDLQSLAIDQVRYDTVLAPKLVIAYNGIDKPLDITSEVKDSMLTWIPPGGFWKIAALYEGLHGKMVERAAPGGEGNVIDHFSEAALKSYLAKFDTAFKGKDISTLRSFFNDSYEVDDARGQSNWTPDLFKEFESRRGYDMKSVLPLLSEYNDFENQRRALYDYRETISDLLLEKFTRPWHQWAGNKKKLVRNQSHGSPANILDLYATIDIPETEGTNLTRFKFATSAANVMGKPLAAAEAATWLNEHFLSTLGDVKNSIDLYFLGGVNHIFYHGTNYSPKNEPWPGWLFYAAVHFNPANSFWNDFPALNEYVARCQSFLQASRPDNDILLYFPFPDRNNTKSYKGLLHHFDGMEGFEGTAFKESAESMTKLGYSWDLISDRQIEQLKVVDGKVKTAGGNYQAIVISGVTYLPLKTLQHLTRLVKAGATVIFYKSIPSKSTGNFNVLIQQKQFDSLINEINFGNSASIANNASKGIWHKGDELNTLLGEAKIKQEKFLAENKLGFIRKKINGGEYYFITNQGNYMFNGWATLTSPLKYAALFDPMKKKSGIARTRRTAANTMEVLLQLFPGESCIVQTSKLPLNANAFVYTEKINSGEMITGNYSVEFMSGGPILPSRATATRLQSWTDFHIDGVREFSGVASYHLKFNKPATSAVLYQVDLGVVKESARVILNGKYIRTLISSPFVVEIPASLLKDENELRIEVSNSMANRIIDLDKRGVEWKKFYNINMPSRLSENRGADGLFTSAKWQPLPSGLLGPVRIAPLKIIK